jgi:hypothetical protein
MFALKKGREQKVALNERHDDKIIMPHGNKKSVRSNKKERIDRRAPLDAVGNAQATGASSTSPSSKEASSPSTARDNLPSTARSSTNEISSRQKTHSFAGAANENIYVRYKKSTERFKDILQSMVPFELFQSDSVDSLLEATDYIVKKDMEVDHALLADLKLSIRLRKREAIEQYSGGDDGHLYFIEVLEYCSSLLAPRRKQKRASAISSAAGQDSLKLSFSNRFQELSFDDDIEDEDDLAQVPLRRPTTTAPIRLTLQQLISTLDDPMGFNAAQFSKVKDESLRVRENDLPSSTIVQYMMEASVAANLAIKQVAALEQAFIHNHPHLNAMYRMLANLSLVGVCDVTSLVTTKLPMASQFREDLAPAPPSVALEHDQDAKQMATTTVAAAVLLPTSGSDHSTVDSGPVSNRRSPPAGDSRGDIPTTLPLDTTSNATTTTTTTTVGVHDDRTGTFEEAEAFFVGRLLQALTDVTQDVYHD